MSQLYNQKSGKSVMENAKFRIKEEKRSELQYEKESIRIIGTFICYSIFICMWKNV